MDILSDVVFTADGEVDPDSGHLPPHRLGPASGALVPRVYDWTPGNRSMSSRGNDL
jgi:hypothetical protein